MLGSSYFLPEVEGELGAHRSRCNTGDSGSYRGEVLFHRCLSNSVEVGQHARQVASIPFQEILPDRVTGDRGLHRGSDCRIPFPRARHRADGTRPVLTC